MSAAEWLLERKGKDRGYTKEMPYAPPPPPPNNERREMIVKVLFAGLDARAAAVHVQVKDGPAGALSAPSGPPAGRIGQISAKPGKQ